MGGYDKWELACKWHLKTHFEVVYVSWSLQRKRKHILKLLWKCSWLGGGKNVRKCPMFWYINRYCIYQSFRNIWYVYLQHGDNTYGIILNRFHAFLWMFRFSPLFIMTHSFMCYRTFLYGFGIFPYGFSHIPLRFLTY